MHNISVSEFRFITAKLQYCVACVLFWMHTLAHSLSTVLLSFALDKLAVI